MHYKPLHLNSTLAEPDYFGSRSIQLQLSKALFVQVLRASLILHNIFEIFRQKEVCVYNAYTNQSR